MKKILLLLCLLYNSYLFSQIAISGVVTDIEGKPLEGASVYINYTSVGTSTNDKGEFYLNLPKGQHDLVVSYVGYFSEKYALSTFTYSEPIQFKLIQKINVLDEIVIERRKKLSLDKKMEFLKRFRLNFLGTSELAKRCKIENEDVLEFDFEYTTQTIKVSASEPLKIINRGLGYTVYYDLLVFELTPNNVFFAGNVRFEEPEFKKGKKRRIERNRLKSYKGSRMHFFRSIVNKNVKEQGFIIDHIERISEKKRPSYEQILAAEKTISEKSLRPNSPVDRRKLQKARDVIEQSQQVEGYKERMIKPNLALYEYANYDNGKPHLQFTDYLRVTYTKGYLDTNFRQVNDFKYQVSLISLYKQKAEILEIGVLKNPLDVYLLGYWGFKKVGDILPLNYNP